jgi:hypothetical protein
MGKNAAHRAVCAVCRRCVAMRLGVYRYLVGLVSGAHPAHTAAPIRSGGNDLRSGSADPESKAKRPELFPKHKNTLLLYMTYGVLSVLWAYTFFMLQNPAGALFVLIAILVVVALMITSASQISPVAGALLLPVFVWLCFALYLNYEFAFLN